MIASMRDSTFFCDASRLALLLVSCDLACVVMTGGVSLVGATSATGFWLRCVLFVGLVFATTLASKRRVALRSYVVAFVFLLALLHFRGYRLRGDGLLVLLVRALARLRSRCRSFESVHQARHRRCQRLATGPGNGACHDTRFLSGGRSPGSRGFGSDMAPSSSRTFTERRRFMMGSPIPISIRWPSATCSSVGSACSCSTAFSVGGFPTTSRFSRLWASGLGSFLGWYLAYHAIYTHALTFCLVAVFLDRWSAGPESVKDYAILGLVLGFATCVRWQNGVFGLLLAPALIARLRERTGRRSALSP